MDCCFLMWCSSIRKLWIVLFLSGELTFSLQSLVDNNISEYHLDALKLDFDGISVLFNSDVRISGPLEDLNISTISNKICLFSSSTLSQPYSLFLCPRSNSAAFIKSSICMKVSSSTQDQLCHNKQTIHSQYFLTLVSVRIIE